MKEQDCNRFNVNLLSPFPSATCTFLAECFGADRMLSHNYATLTQLAALTSTPPLSPFTETLSWNPSSVCWRHHRLKTCRCSLHNTLQAPKWQARALNPRWPDQESVSTLMTEIETFVVGFPTRPGEAQEWKILVYLGGVLKKIQVDFSPCFVFYSSRYFFCINYGNDSEDVFM